MADNVTAGAVVERDNERFKLLFTNSRPEMPQGYKAALSTKPTRVLIRERREAQAAAQ